MAMLLGHDKHLEAEFTVETDADMRIRFAALAHVVVAEMFLVMFCDK